MKFLAGILVSYLVGSVPTGYGIGRIVRGVDIREHGSGNVGATNVFRVVGKAWGLLVLSVDILKGFLSSKWLPLYFSSETVSPYVTALVFGLAAIAGHSWTVWLRFRGGKGVATSIGVLLALAPEAAGAALFVWLLLFAWKRYVSLASLGMALSFPLAILGFYRTAEFFPILFAGGLGLSVFIFYTHRENIRRLRKGTEKRII